MNFGSDERVRNAFRATLIDEPSNSTIGTQELDPSDVLEVTDLADAIARAEEVIRAQSSRLLFGSESSGGLDDVGDRGSRRQSSDRGKRRSGAPMDIFDRLVATDDTAGPAMHAPYMPTLLPRPTSFNAPPAYVPPPATTAGPPAWSRPYPAVPERAESTIPPAARTAPILILDEDAFYHPAGRIRSLADVTLDGYRPEPTLMMRLRVRRHTLSWIVVGLLAPITLLALFAAAVGVGRAQVSRETTQATTTPKAAPETRPEARRETPREALPKTPTETPTETPKAAPPSAATTAAATGAAPRVPEAASASDLPVLDVNSLKSAPSVKSQH